MDMILLCLQVCCAARSHYCSIRLRLHSDDDADDDTKHTNISDWCDIFALHSIHHTPWHHMALIYTRS